jgi:type II secretory pathway pseudopilin PulG
MRNKALRGFTLTEILVATFLLNVSIAGSVTLWKASVRLTEGSRDVAEFYAIARQEAERTRVCRYNDLFFNVAYLGGVAPAITTGYGGDGTASGAAKPALYEAVSSFHRRQTGVEDEQRQLGIQIIEIYRLPHAPADKPLYSTAMFFTVGGV